MKILYVSHLYEPEMGAQPVRVRQLATRWARLGHDVTVLTGFPNHPGGRIYDGFRRRAWKLVDSEIDEGVRVVRTWYVPRPNRGALNRAIAFSSYTLSAALTSLAQRPFDVVIGTVPQPLSPLSAWFRSRVGGAKFVLEVRDLWPEGLVATGQASTSSFSYRALERVASFLHNRADHVVAVTDALSDFVVESRGVPSNRVDVVRAGIDVNAFSADTDASEHKERWGVAGNFVVSYVGTLGNAHDLGVLLRAAKSLQESEPGIRIHIAGTGAEEESLDRLSSDLGLTNTRFLGHQPRNAIPSILAASDVCIATLRPDPVFETVVPTKLYEYMAAGRPVVSNVPGEAARLLEEAGAGVVVTPGDPEAIASAIRRMASDDGARAKMGTSGRSYAGETASWQSRAELYLEILGRVVRSDR